MYTILNKKLEVLSKLQFLQFHSPAANFGNQKAKESFFMLR